MMARRLTPDGRRCNVNPVSCRNASPAFAGGARESRRRSARPGNHSPMSSSSAGHWFQASWRMYSRVRELLAEPVQFLRYLQLYFIQPFRRTDRLLRLVPAHQKGDPPFRHIYFVLVTGLDAALLQPREQARRRGSQGADKDHRSADGLYLLVDIYGHRCPSFSALLPVNTCTAPSLQSQTRLRRDGGSCGALDFLSVDVRQELTHSRGSRRGHGLLSA